VKAGSAWLVAGDGPVRSWERESMYFCKVWAFYIELNFTKLPQAGVVDVVGSSNNVLVQPATRKTRRTTIESERPVQPVPSSSRTARSLSHKQARSAARQLLMDGFPCMVAVHGLCCAPPPAALMAASGQPHGRAEVSYFLFSPTRKQRAHSAPPARSKSMAP
jgi:hypothetical protein